MDNFSKNPQLLLTILKEKYYDLPLQAALELLTQNMVRIFKEK